MSKPEQDTLTSESRNTAADSLSVTTKQTRRKSNAELAAQAVANERDILRNLKRVSIGASTSIGFDPDMSRDSNFEHFVTRQKSKRSSVVINNSEPGNSSIGFQRHGSIRSRSGSLSRKSSISSQASAQNGVLDTSKLLWVPATSHPGIAPENFRKHVQSTITEMTANLSMNDDEESPQLFSSSPSSMVTPSSTTPQPQQSFSETDDRAYDQQNMPSLRELTDELEKLSSFAGLAATDAATLARTLSTSAISNYSSDSFIDLGRQPSTMSETSPKGRRTSVSDGGSSPESDNNMDTPIGLPGGDIKLRRSRWTTYRKKTIKRNEGGSVSLPSSPQLMPSNNEILKDIANRRKRSQDLSKHPLPKMPSGLVEEPIAPLFSDNQKRLVAEHREKESGDKTKAEKEKKRKEREMQREKLKAERKRLEQQRLELEKQQRRLDEMKRNRTEGDRGRESETRASGEERRERSSRERVDKERSERSRVDRERLERERIELERTERERVERERFERERFDRERFEREKIEKDRAERERHERERAERDRAERERAERERVERERAERERVERERIERERYDRYRNSRSSHEGRQNEYRNDKRIENRFDSRGEKLDRDDVPQYQQHYQGSQSPQFQQHSSFQKNGTSYQESQQSGVFQQNSFQSSSPHFQQHYQQSPISSQSSPSNRLQGPANIQPSESPKKKDKKKKTSFTWRKEKKGVPSPGTRSNDENFEHSPSASSSISSYDELKEEDDSSKKVFGLFKKKSMKNIKEKQVSQDPIPYLPNRYEGSSMVDDVPTLERDDRREEYKEERMSSTPGSSLGIRPNQTSMNSYNNNNHNQLPVNQNVGIEMDSRPLRDSDIPLGHQKQVSAGPGIISTGPDIRSSGQFTDSIQSPEAESPENTMDLLGSLVSADMSTFEKLQTFKRLNSVSQKPNQPVQYTDSAFGFPLPPLTYSTIIMLDHRFPMNVERAIYRLSHLKLANPKRELRQQVLLSNFMYAYLNLVNHTLLLQNMEEGASNPMDGGMEEEFPVAEDVVYN